MIPYNSASWYSQYLSDQETLLFFVNDEKQKQTSKNLYSQTQNEEEARILGWHVKNASV